MSHYHLDTVPVRMRGHAAAEFDHDLTVSGDGLLDAIRTTPLPHPPYCSLTLITRFVGSTWVTVPTSILSANF